MAKATKAHRSLLRDYLAFNPQPSTPLLVLSWHETLTIPSVIPPGDLEPSVMAACLDLRGGGGRANSRCGSTASAGDGVQPQ